MEELHSISLYVWNPPEAAVAIHISLEVIERIRALLERQPAETLGVLRGAVLLNSTGVVVVADDFVQARDEAQLRASVSLPSVVGCWRTQADAALEPSDADRNRMARYFPQPWKVLLLIQPKAERGGTAAFFTWMEGALAGGTGGTFPFHSDTLVAEGRPVIEGSRRSQPLRLRESHRSRVGAAAVLALAAAVAGATYMLHPPSRRSSAVSPPAVPQRDRLLESRAPLGQALPEVRSPSADVRKPSALALPQFTVNVLVGSTGPHGKRSGRVKGARKKREGESRVAMPSTREFPPTAPTVIVPAPARVHQPERRLTEARRAEPLLPKAAVTIGPARPAWTVLGWLRRGPFLPPLPVLAARPTVPEGVLHDVWVNVRVRVDAAGKVTAAEPEGHTTDAGLTDAAIAAAREWSFVAARKGDRKVPSKVTLQFRFGGRRYTAHR